MESIIKWKTGKPPKEGIYVVSYKTPTSYEVINAWYSDTGWDLWQSNTHKIIAWCPLSEIEPCKENEEFKVGDIVIYEGSSTKGIMIIASFDYGNGTKFEAARAKIGESIHIKTGSSTIYSGFAPGIKSIKHATDDEIIDFINKEGCQWYLNFYKDWLLENCSRLVNLGLLNK